MKNNDLQGLIQPPIKPGLFSQSFEKFEEGREILRYFREESNELKKLYSDQFDSFKPRNSLSSVSSEILYARNSRNNSNNNSRQNSPVRLVDNKENEINRSLSVPKVSGLSLHLQLDQERCINKIRVFVLFN
jgi:hypothetical protein